jgi:hypothetical protein
MFARRKDRPSAKGQKWPFVVILHTFGKKRVPMGICAGIHEWVETGLLVGAGAWSYYKFIVQRESKPFVQFDLEMRPLGVSGHMRLLELEARLTNKGGVRHYIHQFQFSLFGLKSNDPIVLGGQNINYQVAMEKLIEHRNWVTLTKNGMDEGKSWGYTYVDPGIVQAYRHVTAISPAYTYLLLQARFSYRDKKSGFHTCQTALTV